MSRVVLADREQARVLALRSGVGLQRNGGEAGQRAQPFLQIADHRQRALGLVERGERMQSRELAPADRQHLGRRVQLHGARAERNHGAVKGDVAILEMLQVAHHRRFRMVVIEHRMGEKRCRPAKRGRDRVRRRRVEIAWRERGFLSARERGPDARHVVLGRGLVGRYADASVLEIAEVDPQLARLGDHGTRVRDAGDDGVEKALVLDLDPELPESRGQDRRQAVGAERDARDSLGPVIDRVERGDVGEQDLRRADVAGRFFPPNVLLAGLQRET